MIVNLVLPQARWVLAFAAVLSIQLLGSTARSSDAKRPDYAVQTDGMPAVPRIVAREVCAWPALARLPDGTLLIVNYNRPSHGRMIGDVDSWVSNDHGQTWEKRAVAAPHEPNTLTNRMNVALGALPNGDVLLVASGWSLKPLAAPAEGYEIDRILRPWVSRTTDRGRTWSIDRQCFPEVSPAGGTHTPFGPIQKGEGGHLLVPMYDHAINAKGVSTWDRVYIYRSIDDGRTWGDPVALDPSTRLNETALVYLGSGRWLAFARSTHLTSYESTDDGRTWKKLGQVTGSFCYPANAIVLADRRVLLCYGNRTSGDPRVEAQVSADGGRSWSKSIRLVDVPANPTRGGPEDMGYPSSVQLPDGQIVTAYYARRNKEYDGYHLAVITWNPTRSNVPSR